jgi:hypothetical protein
MLIGIILFVLGLPMILASLICKQLGAEIWQPLLIISGILLVVGFACGNFGSDMNYRRQYEKSLDDFEDHE